MIKSKRLLFLLVGGSGAVCAAACLVVVVTAIFVARPMVTPLVWGPVYATPGMTMTLLEVDCSGPPGHTMVSYAILTTGLPADETYSLWELPFGSRTPGQLADVEVSTAGEVTIISEGQTYPSVAAHDYARGAPFALALMNDDQTIKVVASVIPFPIEAIGEGAVACPLNWPMRAAPAFTSRPTALNPTRSSLP